MKNTDSFSDLPYTPPMLSWFRKKRPLPEAAPLAEATPPPLNETDQEIAAASDAAVSEETTPDHIGDVSDGGINLATPQEERKVTAATAPAAAAENKQGEEGLTAASEEISPRPLARAPLFAAPQSKAAGKTGFFSRLAERLSRTRESFTSQIDRLLYGRKEIDRDLFEQLEELLITADLGYTTTQEILDTARQRVKHQDTDNPQALRDAIRDKMLDYLIRAERDADLARPQNGPFVIMAVGINGVGKTTTIGKMAHKFSNAGYSVLLVAADTFRAAAVSQLKIWGERGGIHVMAKDDGSDPSAVVFDALAHAVAKNYDVVLVDTAGRLHTQQHLMEELKKIKRVMEKKLPGAPHEVLLVLDATTGQNAISQARIFNEAVRVTGVALTKLDGTAKGGIIINVSKELGAPIRFIGVGEQLADLRDFDAR
ncbi:MAG: signal recognition particle-docking protein FtsY, partial [Desulfobulbaceae bacterium]|nr:signal recognition particle-docking protein FtsY [Desulfobulbaceae bacterium]